MRSRGMRSRGMRSRGMRRERARDHRATWLAIGVIVGLVAALI